MALRHFRRESNRGQQTVRTTSTAGRTESAWRRRPSPLPRCPSRPAKAHTETMSAALTNTRPFTHSANLQQRLPPIVLLRRHTSHSHLFDQRLNLVSFLLVCLQHRGKCVDATLTRRMKQQTGAYNTCSAPHPRQHGGHHHVRHIPGLGHCTPSPSWRRADQRTSQRLRSLPADRTWRAVDVRSTTRKAKRGVI